MDKLEIPASCNMKRKAAFVCTLGLALVCYACLHKMSPHLGLFRSFVPASELNLPVSTDRAMMDPKEKDLTSKDPSLKNPALKDPFLTDPSLKDPAIPPPICVPRQHVYFLKVHKAASTSIQNIFLRYGYTHNLSVLVFPRAKFSFPMADFRRMLTFVPVKPPGKYDMYCEHSIYSEAMLRRILPEDTLNFAIVREPLSRLRSAFAYFHVERDLQLKDSPDPVAEFLMNMEKYGINMHRVRRRIQNAMAYDFGYMGSDPGTFLATIEARFLVLIKEKLPESLVIMRRQLCWAVKDILFFQMRSTPHVQTTNQTLTELFRKYSPWDYLIYDHFKAVMDKKIAAQPLDFTHEVVLYKSYMQKTSEFCETICQDISKAIASRDNRTIVLENLHKDINFQATPFHTAFSVAGSDCLLMKFNPEIFRQALRMRYFPEECHKTLFARK